MNVLIVNPASAGGRTAKMAADIQAAAERALGHVKVLLTERRGHAADLAREASDGGAGLVVAVGGDGTFSEVVHGVMLASKRAEVGIIGQGTGGDFCRTLAFEHRLDKYLAALASQRTRPLDVGKATLADGSTRHFVNILSAGMGGLVDQHVSSASRTWGGTAAYFGASVRALLQIRPGHLRVRLTTGSDTSEHKLRSYMIAVCNGRYFGSGMHVAPMATIDDGIFEVVSMDSPSKLAFALQSGRIYSGKHLELGGTKHFRAKRIEIDVENEDARDVFLVDLDGEAMGKLPLVIEVLPSALRLRG